MENNENIGATTPDTQNTQTAEKDYKHEYEKQLLEIEKLKNAISKTNSENAEYKKKELAKMTDDEKKAKEYQDLVDSANQMKAELEQMKLEKSLLANGFTTEESEKLIKANISISDMKVLTDIIKEKVEIAVKSARAEMIKDSTPSSPMGNGNADGKRETPFQIFQKEKNQNNSKKEIKFN
jgi:hypothetical protein